ncbi:MAG: GTPase ObgE [Planctomycetota bacterium]|nr:GTPase ObgE [Planctomycetota bacterium]MEC8512941.1 GTPase ObgE [Planctomycetota bacterium]
MATFRDEAEIEVQAGKGGDGIVSFRREAHVPRGGPDGGDGGRGGSVILHATTNVHSLLDIGRRFRYAAKNGQPGGPRNRTGRSGEDLEVQVPVGTLIYDAERGNLLKDLAEPDATLVVAQGGSAGKGNTRFATSVRQVPRKATLGTPGEHRRLRLELKLFAEVGLLGFPNAGKSTFISRVSAARPKIADYPFTTLEPQVGIAPVGDGYDTLVIADLPGLIEGAAEGAGLGHRFLKHVERCRVLLHLVDVSESAERDPVEAWTALEDELRRYSPELHAKPRLTVGSKCFEDDGWEERLATLAEASGEEVLGVSSVLGQGVDPVLHAARRIVRDA